MCAGFSVSLVSLTGVLWCTSYLGRPMRVLALTPRPAHTKVYIADNYLSSIATILYVTDLESA